MTACVLSGLEAPPRAALFCPLHGWHAPSRTRPGVVYRVHADEAGALRCSCPGFAFRSTCAHVEAVEGARGEVRP